MDITNIWVWVAVACGIVVLVALVCLRCCWFYYYANIKERERRGRQPSRSGPEQGGGRGRLIVLERHQAAKDLEMERMRSVIETKAEDEYHL